MMLMDFCHPSVKTLIKSDKVSFDGYEVTNLLSEDPSKRSRGFICDHFIKPPVNIYFQFPCNISIYRIIINPVVSQQKSCDIKLLSATKIMRESWLYGKDQTSVQLEGIFFNCIGSVSKDDPETVCFENSFFPRRATLNGCDRDFSCKANLNSKRHCSLTTVSHINICIYRAKFGKAVAIQSVEIWGIPSSKVPKHVQDKLQTVYMKAVAAIKQRPESSATETINAPMEKKHDNSSALQQSLLTIEQNGVLIPEDFLDPLTFEIMTVPLLLPSGKSIDQFTLDKFVNVEASWGRQPSDPFTGLPFTAKSKPEINISLKSRIDQFVLSHSDKLETPRTLGHSECRTTAKHLCFGESHLKSSRLTNNNNPAETLKIDNMKSFMNGKRDLDDKTVNPETVNNAKKTKMSSNTSTLSDSKYVHTISDKSIEQSSNTWRITSASPFNPDVHSTDLTSSLDSALEAALGGLPSFSARKSATCSANAPTHQGEDSGTKTSCCANCKLSILDSTMLKYSLPCGHLVCRQCLTNESADVKKRGLFFCAMCKTHCNSSEVVRLF
ncbi:RING finger protein 37-like [Dreissena polymorpha]|uniref:RING finger protein 37 n=1 Tax=Dreissena polymorpha TaxID=45954 RepID=A0A9D4ESI3_DREPO|nr:RING finger protein 37-like [Dreissena polymorpha]XP_052225379.1 RING finger protein 37-like [Dreissena polymorpha]KAH3785710.1 hypothetical protein DPMN_163804 [Dreissena polymorpha]